MQFVAQEKHDIDHDRESYDNPDIRYKVSPKSADQSTEDHGL